MYNKPSKNRYNLLIYIFFLIFISTSVNQYYAYLGVLPVDSFSTFNAGYDILNGSVPFRDYWVLKGIVLDIIQSAFFKLFGISGNDLDYFSVKGTTAIDFRADNDTNFESLEKNSLDLYSSLKSIYLQNRENKIRNSIQDEDEWGNLDN